MVPTDVLPPGTASTLQLTPPPAITDALNCCVCVVITTAANGGEMLTAETVNIIPALATPLTVTTTLPLVAAAGTGTTIEVARQLVGTAAVPLNVTVLVPCVAPKFAPRIVTATPAAPDAGDKLVMLGVASTVNDIPALAVPPTVITTLPVVAPAGTGTTIEVALQLVGVAAVPLNFTALVPALAPKFMPVIVIAAPTAPDVGDTLVMIGDAGGGGASEPPLLPQPDSPSAVPIAIPRQPTPARCATFLYLAQRHFIDNEWENLNTGTVGQYGGCEPQRK
jgi:hypothetical protein